MATWSAGSGVSARGPFDTEKESRGRRRGVRVPSDAEVLHRVGARIDPGEASVMPERDPQLPSTTAGPPIPRPG